MWLKQAISRKHTKRMLMKLKISYWTLRTQLWEKSWKGKSSWEMKSDLLPHQMSWNQSWKDWLPNNFISLPIMDNGQTKKVCSLPKSYVIKELFRVHLLAHSTAKGWSQKRLWTWRAKKTSIQEWKRKNAERNCGKYWFISLTKTKNETITCYLQRSCVYDL